MTITMYKGDLPKNLDFGDSVAIDTETLGLIPERDPLCLIQLSSGDGTAHLLQFDRSNYDAPNDFQWNSLIVLQFTVQK